LAYQSGFDYELLRQTDGRPGLVTHTLAVSHNARLGHDTYDLLAGTAQYKASLASSQESMVWAEVHRITLAFRLEEALRDAKRRWQDVSSARRASGPGSTKAGTTAMDAH
jgi:CelD/BcsL family acetyltransferase involved in cellulose biosynthesis